MYEYNDMFIFIYELWHESQHCHTAQVIASVSWTGYTCCISLMPQIVAPSIKWGKLWWPVSWRGQKKRVNWKEFTQNLFGPIKPFHLSKKSELLHLKNSAYSVRAICWLVCSLELGHIKGRESLESNNSSFKWQYVAIGFWRMRCIPVVCFPLLLNFS